MQLSDDLMKVPSGVKIPIVMLDRDRRVRRLTPKAESLLQVLPSDIGRPLADFRLGLPHRRKIYR